MSSKVYTNFQDIPSFTPWSSYVIDMWWEWMEKWLEDHDKDMGIELDPDFQRGHVWSREQQIAYVEHCLRGGRSTSMLHWNCHDWNECTGKYPITLVDGKQRLTAVRDFMNNEFPAFGTRYGEFNGRMRAVGGGASFRFHINDLATRTDMLKWYLELNAGGVVHTNEELDKVREMLEKEG